jgi:NAD(P)-dependent dehydrogenase (short-subunit alcohol dehydrogenase family)
MARQFAAAGADVAIMAQRRGPLDDAVGAIRATPGQRVLAVACDVARANDIERGYRDVAAELGTIDILVNNTGM